MSKMCLAFLGALLLVLHPFSSQMVQAQTPTAAPMDATMNTTMPSYTMTATVNTTSKDNGCGSTAAFTLLLPLAAAASLLHSFSQ